MTGLFHRLARQVVGPEPPRVRSATRLPFAGPPSLEQRHAEAPRAVEASRSVAMPEDALRRVVSRLPDGGPMPHGEETSEPPRLMPEAGEQARGRAEMRPDGAPPTMVPMQQGTSAGAAAPESAGAQPSSTATAAGPGRRDDLSARTPRGHPPEPAPETPPAPRPLLPEVPQSAALPSTAVPVRSQGKADAEQPEVHVHIGRIDVTSVAEPQPQRRDPPRRREPAMSLEDYLSKRKSGG